MKSILVIDDDKEILELTKSRLEKQGYRIIVAENGEEGIRIVGQDKPNLILLDVVMPGKDGFTVLRELRASDQAWDIPVIMLTAKGETSFILEGMQYGAVDYFIKPLEWDQLIRQIKKSMEIADAE